MTTEKLDGSGQPFITLAALLKKEQLTGTGGMAKAFVREGGVLVNGVEETRPGRKLHEGDIVTVEGKSLTVQLG